MKFLKYDLSSSIVVFLVALPLCLGIALASGVPFMSGVLSGVIGGIVIGFLSNSPFSVSGPAAGLVAVVLSGVEKLGSIEAFFLTVSLAGLIQVILGLLKAGIVSSYFPSNVIKGMLTGIGVIIILKQIPHAVGYDAEVEGEMSFLQIDGENTFSALISALNHVNFGAILVCVLGLSIIFLFDHPSVKSKIRFIPGSLIAVLLGVFLNEIIFKGNKFLEIGSYHCVSVPIITNFLEFKNTLILPDFSYILNKGVWSLAITIAMVASVESLLSIEAVDNLDPAKRVTNTNRELIAQGIGNFLAGLIGSLPITSVIVRSSANVNAGAKSKLSTILHGLLLFLAVIIVPSLLNLIPLSALAAILLHTGYKLAKPSIFVAQWKNGASQWIPFIVTILAVVFTDLLMGVGIGLGASILFLLKENLANSYRLEKEPIGAEDIIKISLSEEVSFLNKAAIRQSLDDIPEGAKVEIDASRSEFIDFDVIELIKEFRDIKSKIKGVDLKLVGFKEHYQLHNHIDIQHKR